MLRMFLVILFSFVLASCGGGGGGGSTGGSPARPFISVSPRNIDAGDRFSVEIDLVDVDTEDTEALYIKVLHPSGIAFTGEATLSLSNSPDLPLTVVTANSDESAYVLFYITTLTFKNNSTRSGTIRFRMVGNAQVLNGTISVDVDTAGRDVRQSFNPANAGFTALDSESIEVLN